MLMARGVARELATLKHTRNAPIRTHARQGLFTCCAAAIELCPQAAERDAPELHFFPRSGTFQPGSESAARRPPPTPDPLADHAPCRESSPPLVKFRYGHVMSSPAIICALCATAASSRLIRSRESATCPPQLEQRTYNCRRKGADTTRMPQRSMRRALDGRECERVRRECV